MVCVGRRWAGCTGFLAALSRRASDHCAVGRHCAVARYGIPSSARSQRVPYILFLASAASRTSGAAADPQPERPLVSLSGEKQKHATTVTSKSHQQSNDPKCDLLCVLVQWFSICFQIGPRTPKTYQMSSPGKRSQQ